MRHAYQKKKVKKGARSRRPGLVYVLHVAALSVSVFRIARAPASANSTSACTGGAKENKKKRVTSGKTGLAASLWIELMDAICRGEKGRPAESRSSTDSRRPRAAERWCPLFLSLFRRGENRFSGDRRLAALLMIFARFVTAVRLLGLGWLMAWKNIGRVLLQVSFDACIFILMGNGKVPDFVKSRNVFIVG